MFFFLVGGGRRGAPSLLRTRQQKKQQRVIEMGKGDERPPMAVRQKKTEIKIKNGINR